MLVASPGSSKRAGVSVLLTCTGREATQRISLRVAKHTSAFGVEYANLRPALVARARESQAYSAMSSPTRGTMSL